MHNQRKKKVITIHGINTDGEWQEEIKAVLNPHFECVSIKYDEYRRLGETKILFDPLVASSGVLLSIFMKSGIISLVAYLSITAVIATGVSVYRRKKTLAKVKKDFDSVYFTGKSPHLVAHSLGTYFIGSILAKFPDVRIDHLVLAGCVLKRSTPWGNFLKKNPRAVKRVRNEMAAKDLVAKAALYFYGLFPGLGHAGVKGFKDLAHTVEPNSGCGVECTVLVHNVKLEEMGHSDIFIGRGYAQRFWLPFLWSLDPQDYEDFIEMCLLADKLEKENDLQNMSIVEDEILHRRWRWTNNFTLKDYLKDLIEFLLKQKGARPLRTIVRPIRDLAVREMWHIVARAYETQEAGESAEDPSLTRFLHPKMAALAAVNNADR